MKAMFFAPPPILNLFNLDIFSNTCRLTDRSPPDDESVMFHSLENIMIAPARARNLRRISKTTSEKVGPPLYTHIVNRLVIVNKICRQHAEFCLSPNNASSIVSARLQAEKDFADIDRDKENDRPLSRVVS